MSEDRRSPGTDPTMTPSQVIGEAQTSASSTAIPARPSTAALPARYALGPRIGAGGMGEVILANDQMIGREVAVKRMRVSATESATARFMREARIQGRLDHPAIVPVHELGTDTEGHPFFVMKRLTGTTLAEILVRRSAPRQKLLRAFADICLAIEFAHSRGVVHRDLKPENIMLGDFGEVYVLDWGIAHVDGGDEVARDDEAVLAPGTTEAGAILGTPGYIAPEQVRGEPIDGRADVYALGCILFEILAGQPLLPRGRAALQAALAAVDARPSSKAPGNDTPPELDEICAAATALDRARRPTARELADRIERFLDGDRDLALRKQLAATHLEAARAALAAGDGEAERIAAMREAGRAIAIDPRDSGAAQLVGRLMLEPPREIPREVEARITAVEEETARDKVRIMEKTVAAFLLFVPASLLIGLRSTAALVAFAAVVVVNLASTMLVARQAKPPSARNIYVAASLFAIVVAMVGRFFSPFLLAPALAAVTVMIFAVDPRVRWSVITFGYIAIVIAPWLLELVGAVPKTMFATAGDLRIRSDILFMSSPAGEIGLAAFASTLIGTVGYVASRLAIAHRSAVRSIELQAWHLRQLVR